MKIIDFRFRPNTPEIINGIKNSSMFKATCEAIGFDKRVPQALPEIVADLDRRGVELCVVSGRDCETTYGFPANNNSILEFCRAYPNKFLGFWGIDPHKGMDAVREVEHVIKDLGMRGIATDPYLAHCPPSDARLAIKHPLPKHQRRGPQKPYSPLRPRALRSHSSCSVSCIGKTLDPSTSW